MAMGEESFEERTEEATPQRREEFKNEGKVLQSKDLVGAFLLLASSASLYFASGWIFKGLGSVFETSFQSIPMAASREWSVPFVASMLDYSLRAMAYILAPIGLISMVVSVGTSMAQSGVVFTTKPLEPDLTKLNPLNALGRIFGLDGLFELAKAVFKLIVAGFVSYVFLRHRIIESGVLWQIESKSFVAYLAWNVLLIIFWVGGAMLVMAMLDFGYQWWRFEERLKMTKTEAKEDRKQSEGNPQIKARVRALQRRAATRKMVEAVKKADVVVTNPTHLAVALLYDRESMLAPKVVAMGADHMAMRIRKIAKEAGVPIVENKPLARALYKAMKVGQFIGKEFFNAVAEVLAYVYRLKGRTQL